MLRNKKAQGLDISAIPAVFLRFMVLVIVGIIFYALMPIINGFVSDSLIHDPNFLTRLALLSIVPGGWFLYFLGGIFFLKYGVERSE